MSDRTKAAELYDTRPNMTWEETLKKYTDKDGKVDYQGIIDASQRSNETVNQQLGIQKK
ncbi:MAG TPA: hypothetical protein VN721_06680 [Flavipsychrobacter sp.]|nr:hypothetical protein [Flavipsychrobacter sp.]